MKRCALLVDDDPDDLIIEGRQLHALGLEVISASTVEQARVALINQLAARPGQPFDIALIDLRLIGSAEDGLALMRYLREVCPGLPVVLVSGSINPGLLHELEAARHISLAWKPLANETLEQLLSSYKITARAQTL